MTIGSLLQQLGLELSLLLCRLAGKDSLEVFLEILLSLWSVEREELWDDSPEVLELLDVFLSLKETFTGRLKRESRGVPWTLE